MEGAPRAANYYNARAPQEKPGPFDADRAEQPRTKLELRTGAYNSVDPHFAITFNKNEFSGYNGGCPFTGTLKDGDDKHYKQVTLTYTAFCYLNAPRQVPVLKNAKLEGVIFASRRVDTSNIQQVDVDVMVMIMRPKAGQYNLGFSRMFNRQ